MLIQNQLVEVKITPSNVKHFRNFGYQVKMMDIIFVPIEHLMDNSHSKIWVQCDVCGENYQKEYRTYVNGHSYNMDTCTNCSYIKSQKTCMERYGVKNVANLQEVKEKKETTCLEKYGETNVAKTPEVQDKMKQTNIKRYGVPYAVQNSDIQEKIIQTNLERYGYERATQNKEVQDKIKATMLTRYGVEHVMQSEEFRQKIKSTNLQRYGFESPLQSPDIQQKIINTNMERYGVPYAILSTSIQISSQQRKIYELIKQKYSNAELNYPFSNCLLDVFVCINNINIDIEYDGGYWHQDQQQDIRRDKFLQAQGFKVLRIRSGHKIPSEEELFFAINELVTTNRIFKEIILLDWKEQHKINEGQEVSV